VIFKIVLAYFIICGFYTNIWAVNVYFVFMTYFIVYATLAYEWARKCWSFMDMSGHISASPSFACVKVDDYCDLFSTGTLTCVKIIEIFVESAFATDNA
jgi:hypothetical protein